MTLAVTSDDVEDYMSHQTEYVKANRFSELMLDIYI